MGEFTVHNVRFYDFEPKSIQCMSYEDESNRLALSRADGSVEIWNCKHRPFMQQVIHGDEDSSVEALAWCNGRLFSAGLHGFLLEYDLASCTVRSRTAVTGGPTWCLALSPNKQKLAAGTEDGYVCLFNVNENRVLYDKSLAKQEGRILSIGWHLSGNYIVTGSVNCVRLWSLKDGRVTRCSMGQTRGREIIVWCVAILDDMTIVSGDSRGKTCFWNSTLGTMTQYVQTHKADVLSLVICPEQKSLYVAGVDPTIVQVKLVQTGSKSGRKECWMRSLPRSIHTHDVRAMALTTNGKLYSGGVDTVLALSYYPPKTVIKYRALPHPGSISIASDAESILLRYKDHLDLWRLGHYEGNKKKPSGSFLPISQDRVKLLELQCKEDEVTEWSAISSSGKWIAYIVHGNHRLFHFNLPKDGKGLSLQRIKTMNESIKQCRQVLWIAEGMLASVALDDTIQIISVTESEAEVDMELCLEEGHSVNKMKANSEGSILVVADNHEVITAFNLRKDTKSVLPKYSAPVTALGIHPVTSDVVVVYADMMVKEYSLQTQHYTPFCREFLSECPAELTKRNSVVHDVSFDVRHKNLVLLHDDSAIIVLNKAKSVSEPYVNNKPAKMKRRDSPARRMNGKIEKGKSTLCFTIARRPNQILHFSHVKNESVVSVELDDLQLLDKLPPTLKVKKYGGM